jgi:5'-3' exonuclease
MGVKGLYSYLKLYRQDLRLDDCSHQPKRIGVDALSLMYKYKADTADAIHLLEELKRRGHTILLVFDGRAPEEKQSEVKQRQTQRTKAAQQASDLKAFLSSESASELDRKTLDFLEFSAARLQYQGWQLTREVRHAFQDKLWTLDIPYVKAIGEADTLLLQLYQAKKLDCILSTDMDYLLGGVQDLWIPVRRGPVEFERLSLDQILEGESLTFSAFLDACILCGVEQLRDQHICVPPAKAFQWMRYYGSIEALLQSSVDIQGLEYLGQGCLEKLRQTWTCTVETWAATIKESHYEKRKDFLEQL